MPSINISPTPKKKAGKCSTKRSPDTQLYLRSISDLTLHGGVDSSGRLIVLPIFSGLGLKGIKAQEYLQYSGDIWRSGRLAACFAGKLDFSDTFKVYWALYPSLTSVFPLPSAAVIDRILTDDEHENFSRDVAFTQVNRCALSPRWRRYRLLGREIGCDLSTVDSLLLMNDEHRGLLTPNFEKVLVALRNLNLAIDAAEAECRFMALDDTDIVAALNPQETGIYKSRYSAASASWATFYKDLNKWSESHRLLILDPNLQIATDKEKSFIKMLSSGRPHWALVADIGGGELRDFVTNLENAQGYSAISTEHKRTQLGDQTSHRYLDMSATFMCQGRGKRTQETLSVVMQVLIARGLAKNFYKSQASSFPLIAQAYTRRFDPSSALAPFLSCFPSRPLALGGAILVKPASSFEGRESDGRVANRVDEPAVQIEPAVWRPQAASMSTAARNKKVPNVSDHFLSLNSSDSNSRWPTLYVSESEQIVWPQGQLWQAVDMATTLISRPHLFLCPEVLNQGFIRFRVADWEVEETREKSDSEPLDSTGHNWDSVYDLFLGASPWPTLAELPKRITLYHPLNGEAWPLTIQETGISEEDVRLAVRFVPSAGGSALAHIDSIAHLLRARAGRPEAGQDQSNGLNQFLQEFGENLRFEAQPFFEVNGEAVEEVDWFKAIKVGTKSYRLPNGLVLETGFYQKKTDQFILRKRAYAKLRNLKFADIWREQQKVLASSSKSMNPEEYIRQLSLHITPVLKDLDAKALGPMTQSLLTDDRCKDLAKVLRPYQAEGLGWCYLRFQLGLGVCLADEMGLGKTLQAIAIIRSLHRAKSHTLVVMPKSLLINWQRELARFGGDLRVGVQGDMDSIKNYDVVLATYPRLRIDQDSLTKISWNLVILDEAQAIKNTGTQVTEVAGRLNARYRLALTGTPVENRAAELWSLINWLNPGYLGQQIDFNSYTSLARSSSQKAILLAPLRESLGPLILRRMKSDPQVALGLPDKIAVDQACELSEEQFILYQSVIEAVLVQESLGESAFVRRALYLKAILHLKQICIHPDLFYGDQNEDEILGEIDSAQSKKIRQLVRKRLKQQSNTALFGEWLSRSAKLSAIREIVDAVREQSRGILIFTQYRGAAELLKRALDEGLHTYTPFIHGGLSGQARLDLVDEFNESCRTLRPGESCPILILSLKAGGTGLNLTGADRVIHMDRWWNPAVEDQATDRAHRIGQDRTVFIHTITGQGTIEEAIANLFVQKRRLADDLLGAAGSDDVGEYLKSDDGFRSLVDPKGIFTKQFLDGSSPSPYLS